MEAEKSHDLPSASWRTWKTKGIIQSETDSPKTRSSGLQGQEKMCLSSRKERKFPLTLFFSILALSGLDDAYPHWGGRIFFTQSSQSNANLLQKHPHRHIQKSYLFAISVPLSPVKLTHKTNHHNDVIDLRVLIS